MHIHRLYQIRSIRSGELFWGAIYGGTFYWGVDQVNVHRVWRGQPETSPLACHVLRPF